MQHRILGSTGLSVSVVGIGTWQFGGEWGGPFSQATVDEIFDAGRACGINLIDTAECYGDHESERLIGQSVKRDRANWIIATKFGHKFNNNFERSEPRSVSDVVEQTDESLAALQTDYIDVQQYHSWGDTQFFDDDILAALNKMKEQGKIRHIGNSVGHNMNVKQIAASQPRGVEVIQLIYNRLDCGPDTMSLPICVAQNLGVLARVPLASGYLSGKYRPGHTFDANEVRGKWHDPIDRDNSLREVEKIAQTELPEGMDMATWALAWCLRNAAITSVIPGCKSGAQVRANAAASDVAV